MVPHSVGDLIKREVDGLWFEAHVLEVKQKNIQKDRDTYCNTRSKRRDRNTDISTCDEKEENKEIDAAEAEEYMCRQSQSCNYTCNFNYTYKILYVDDHNIEDNVEHFDTELLVAQHDKTLSILGCNSNESKRKINEIITKVEAEQVAKSPPVFVPLNDLLLSDITTEDEFNKKQITGAVIHNKTGILSEEEILQVAEAQAQYQIINNQPNEKLAIGGGLRGLRGLQTLRKATNFDSSDDI